MPGDSFAVDTSTLVTYTFTDDAGNMAVCIFAVSVTSAPDDPPNIVFCPPNIMEMATAGAETLSVLWQEPVAQDDSELPVGVIASHMPGDLFVVDDTTSVIYTFTDNAGQVAVCTFTVTVTAPADVNPPSVTGCPMSVSFERVATGSSIAVVEWVEAVATDQESAVTVEQSHAPPLLLAVGATVLVTYTFSDRSGNSARCSFTIFVLPADSTPPVFMNCPNNIRVPARVTDGDLSAVGWLEPVAMDRDSEPVVVNVNFPPGTEFPVGAPVSVVYTATDSAAVPNTAECTFIVEVLPFDNVDPVIINCPAAITESVLPSVNTLQVFWTPPMTVDIATFTSNFQPGDDFAADSTTEVEYTLTDSSGNTATCDFTVTVVRDGDPPALQVTCPRLDIEMSFPLGIQEVAIATLWPTLVAVEQFLQVMTTVSVNPDYPNFANGFLPVDGVQRQVRYRFMDSLGNAMDCLFFVTLNEDTGPAPPPVFTTCPTTVLFTLTAQTGATASRTWPAVQAADPNGGPVTLTSTPANIDSFPVGSTSVIITATNEEGTFSVCTFFVLVTADDIPPEANCPTSVMEVLPMAVDTVVVTWNVEFTDNSGTVTVMQEGPRSGDSFGEGTSTVVYTATDEAGNVVTCSFNIIVTVDMVRPTPSDCPTPFTAYTNDPSPQMVVLPQTEAVDANGITLIGVQTDPAVNLFTPNNPPQPQTVTFTFTDGAGRTAECMIELNFILDQTNPTFVNCPSGTVSATLTPGMATVAVPAVQMISALDDSNNDPTVTTNPADITMFPFGMTPVTFTATDMAGNTAQCNFIVDVNAMPCNPNPCPSPLTEVCTPVLPTNTFTCAADADPPIVFGCPNPMMPVRADPIPGDSTVVISNLPVVTATDNHDEDLDVVSTVPDGNIFPAGTTTVTITFTDDAGNVATCMYDVIVADDVNPVIEGCPPPPDRAIQVTLSDGQDTITVPELTVTDNLDANPTVIRVPDSNVFPAGITPVSVTATDLSGNVDVCAYNVIVSSPCDNVMCTPPSRCVSGPTGATCGVSCEFSVCDTPTFFCLEIQPGIGTCSGNSPECLANCPVPTPEVSCQAGHCVNSPVARTDCPQGCLVGQTCVNGNCVADSVPPTVTCPTTDVTQSVPSNQEVATIMVLEMITVNDNLDPNPVVLTSPFDNQFSAGATRVTATAIDDAGNMAMCSFSVVVTANTAPNNLNCPSVTVHAVQGNTRPEANYGPFHCSNADQQMSIQATCNPPSGTRLSIGRHMVTCRCGDLFGAVGQCTFDVTVVDVNECATSAGHSCDTSSSDCQNTEGHYICQCKNGFIGADYTPPSSVTCQRDTTKPEVFSCPSSKFQTVQIGTQSTTVTWTEPVAVDNSMSVSLTLRSHVPGSDFSVGKTTVTYVFTDPAGNTAVCTFDVSVVEDCTELNVGTQCDPGATCDCMDESCDPDTGICSSSCTILTCPASIESVVWSRVNPSSSVTINCTLRGSTAILMRLQLTLSSKSERQDQSGITALTGNGINTGDSVEGFFRVDNATKEKNLYCVLFQGNHVIGRVSVTDFVNELPILNAAPILEDVSNTSVIISWRAWDVTIDVGDPPVVAYIPYYKRESSETWISGPTTETGEALDFKADSLDVDALYEFSVAAVRQGENGEGPRSPFVTVKTFCNVPDQAASVNVQLTSSNRFNVSWLLSPGEIMCSTGVTGYKVYYRIEGSTDENLQLVGTVDDVTIRWFIIDEALLEPGTTYSFFVTITTDQESDLTESSVIEAPVTSAVPLYLIILIIIAVVVVAVIVIIFIVRYQTQKHFQGKETTKAEDGEDADYVNAAIADDPDDYIPLEKQSMTVSSSKYEDLNQTPQYSVSLPSQYEITIVPEPQKPVAAPRNQTKNVKGVNSGAYEDVGISSGNRQLPDVPQSHPSGDEVEEASYEVPDKLEEYTGVYVNKAYEKKLVQPQPIKVAEFQKFMNRNKEDVVRDIFHQFMALPSGNQYPWSVALKFQNKPKNFFKTILPYDHSRVKLDTAGSDTRSDYINASYIKNNQGKTSFIAAQGPQEGTVDDFWKMVWEQNVETIVMVTDTSEKNKPLCSTYWPSKIHMGEVFDDITVLLMESTSYITHTIRKLNLLKGNQKAEVHTITQVQVHSWPYGGVPKETSSLIPIVRKVKTLHTDGSLSPLLVHCSNGVGATGTFIAVYVMMDIVKKNKDISVFDFVKRMRDDRVDMVQTRIQYLFIFEFLLAVLQSTDSQMSRDQLKKLGHAAIKLKSKKEFKVLQESVVDYQNCEGYVGNSPENQHKNRFSKLIPGDKFRPVLKSQGNLFGSNSYINAFHLDFEGREFIMTQAPLSSTVEDFWRLVYDYGCTTIVMLNTVDGSDETVLQYWPSGGGAQYGLMRVECKNTMKSDSSIQSQFQVTHKKVEEKSVSVDHFAFCGWSGNQPNVSKLRQFIRYTENKGPGPVLVHCINGVGLSPVYVIVKTESERLEQEGFVDVFQSLKKLRKNCPPAIQTQEEYTLCYQLLKDHLDNPEEYAVVY